jgi:hypothetical protein
LVFELKALLEDGFDLGLLLLLGEEGLGLLAGLKF